MNRLFIPIGTPLSVRYFLFTETLSVNNFFLFKYTRFVILKIWSNQKFLNMFYLWYSRITLVVPNYEAAPRLFYSEYFWQRYITCDSAADQELPMGKIFPEILNLCESRKFCDDPASRSANWDQVNKIFSQFQRNLWNCQIWIVKNILSRKV